MDNKEKSPEQELIESISLMIEKAMESNTNIYTGVVKSVDGKRAVVTVNGQNQNVSIATADVSSGNVVRVFVPKGNMSAAFIIKAEASGGGGGTTTTAYGDLTGKPRINGVTLVDNKTSKELNLYGTGNEPPYPVTSVNGKTGDVTISTGGNVDSVNGKTGVVVLSAADVGALPNTTVIPDKTSQLTNDSGFITNSALTDYAKKTEIPTKTSELTNDSGYITNAALEPYAKTVDVPTKTSELTNDSGYITDAALTGYAKTTDIPTKTSQLDNDSNYITAGEAPVQSVNTKTGAVVLTQDDVGDGKTYVRTHNDFTDDLKAQINTNKDNIVTINNDITQIQTTLTDKQDTIVGAASTITENNLTANRALVSNSSGKVAVSNVTSTELGYLDGVTSNVQEQLNNKLETVPVTSVDGETGAVVTNAVKTTAQDLSISQKAQARTNIGAGTSNFSGSYDDLTNKPTIPGPYILPVASSTTLGGVKPVAKTTDMTQSVGVDANGALYTIPGGGGTGSGDMLKSVYDATGTVEQAGGIPDYVANNAPVTSVNGKTGVITVHEVPSVTTTDNGKFLRVVNGTWAAVEIANANGGSF